VKVLVLGGGVVGIASAYFLAEDGHEVTVLDRGAAAASEASAGNAGLYTPGDSFAWASPGALKVMVKSMLGSDQGIKVRPRLDPRLMAWGWRFLFECTHARARINTLRKLRIALYSRDCLADVVTRTRVEFDHGKGGVLYFYRSPDSFAHGCGHMQILADHGLSIERCDPDRLAELDPALGPARGRLAGGLYSPMDQTGDSRAFARNLADWCRTNRGVVFAFGTRVDGIETEGDRVARVRTDKGDFAADLFVLALGADSPLVAESIGVRLPIYPVKGYSATIPVADPVRAPRLGGVDEDRLVAYSRLGGRLRVASTAEFAGYDRSHRADDFHTLFRVVGELFPGAADESRAELWAGLRPMTPSSVPILGRARYRNLFLNVGHGHVGWTMSCGTARVVADLVAGRRPGIDTEGLLYEG
jgi:D-amino-acid dehydrogenase